MVMPKQAARVDLSFLDALVARDPFDLLQSALRSGDIEAAMRLLNSRTRHRFTAIHRIQPPHMFCALEFDREQQAVSLNPRPLSAHESYSAVVLATGAPFLTEFAPLDARLGQHPARNSIVAYVGVPLRTRAGDIRGVLCHYDYRPRAAPRAEIDAMERAVPVAQSWLLGNA